MKTKERIVQFIDFKGISKRKFCEKISLSHTIFNKKSALGSDKLELIAMQYLELNMDWVITGRDEMLYKTKTNIMDNRPDFFLTTEEILRNLSLVELHYGANLRSQNFNRGIKIKAVDEYLYDKKLFTRDEIDHVKLVYDLDLWEMTTNLVGNITDGNTKIVFAEMDDAQKESIKKSWEAAVQKHKMREIEKQKYTQEDILSVAADPEAVYKKDVEKVKKK